jgi:hypothetical protein
MNRIKYVSLFFRILFQILFVTLPVISIIFWVNAPEPITLLNGMISLNFIPASYTATADHTTKILHTLNSSEKIFGFCVSAIPMLIELSIVYSLIKLFKLYEGGEFFSINNVRYIRNAGYALLLGQLINPLYEGLIGIVLTWYNPVGHRFFAITFDQTNIGMVLTALLIILISWIMAEACKLREDQQLTI